MRKALIVSFLWVGLFGGTILVRSLYYHTNRTAEASATKRDSDALEYLNQLPRKTSADVVVLSDPDTVAKYKGFLGELETALRRATTKFTDCRDSFMARSFRAKEYVEVSFIVEDTIAGDRPLALKNVVIERTSIQLEVLDEECLRSAIESVAISNSEHPSSRVAYPICFGHPPNQLVR